MANNQTASVTLDASFVIGLCAKEPRKYAKAQAELRQRVSSGCSLFAPHLLVMEAAFVLCGKLQNGTLTAVEHSAALANLWTTLAQINFLPGGDRALLARAEQLRQGYGLPLRGRLLHRPCGTPRDDRPLGTPDLRRRTAEASNSPGTHSDRHAAHLLGSGPLLSRSAAGGRNARRSGRTSI